MAAAWSSGLGIGFGLANLLGTAAGLADPEPAAARAGRLAIGRSLVRMHAATLPAALIAILVGLLSSNPYVTVIFGGGLAVLLYLSFARALRIDELSSLTRTVLARVRR